MGRWKEYILTGSGTALGPTPALYKICSAITSILVTLDVIQFDDTEFKRYQRSFDTCISFAVSNHTIRITYNVEALPQNSTTFPNDF